MRISDWSSDVCSSDLLVGRRRLGHRVRESIQRARRNCRRRRRSYLADVGEYDPLLRQPPGHIRWRGQGEGRSEEHTSELQSLMRISYAVFCLKKKIKQT